MDASAAPILAWFRRDLRVGDNPALAAAASSGRPIIPVFILDDETPGLRAPGGASRWWLHGALAALAADLDAAGSRLILRRGAADRVLDDLIAETGATAVHWNRLYDAGGISRDTEIKSSLKDRGIAAESFNGSLLFEPWEIETKAGSWFKVYTRFWQACRAAGDPPPPIDTPRAMPAPGAWPECDDLEAWALLPQAPDWAAGFRDHWTPGAAGASARLKHFLSDSV